MSGEFGLRVGGRGGSFGSEFFSEVLKYLNVLTDSEIAKLEILKQKYLSTIDISKKNVNDLDYSDWNDEVSTRLNSFTKSLNDKLLVEIENDLNSGSFSFLVNEIKKLKAECEKYKVEENKNISLSFSDFEDRKKYDNNNYPLSTVGQQELSNHKKALETRRNNLITYENNIKAILESIKNISFGGTYIESIATEAPSVTTTNLPSGWTQLENGFLVTSGFMYTNYGETQESGQILLDPTTGNRIIETQDGLLLYKLAEDGIFLEWFINDNNATIDSDIAINLLKNGFENVEESGWTISKRAYGENMELTPGRHAESFENWVTKYSVQINGSSVEILSFPGDPTISYLASEGLEVSNLKDDSDSGFIPEEEPIKITKIE